MAEGLGGVAAAGAAAAATGTTTTATGAEGTAPNTGTPATGGAPGNQGGGKGGQPSAKALEGAKPTAGQQGGETKTWDVPVDGQIVKMTAEEMRDAASLVKASYKRFEEGAGAKKAAEAFMKEFETDPLGAIDKLKIDPAKKRQMIEDYYKKNYIDQDAMSPEQKELQETKKERDALKAEKEREAEEKKLETKKKAVGEWQQHFTKLISDALDKGGLPKTPKTVGRMAFYLQQNALNKITQTMDQVAARVEADYSEEFQGLVAADAPVDRILKILGPDVVKKLQRYALEQHKAKLAGNLGKPAEPSGTTTTKEKPRKEGAPEGWGGVNKYWTRRDK